MPKGSEKVPSGELTVCNGKSPFLMGKSTISTGPFSIAMLVHQRVEFTTTVEMDVELLSFGVTHRFLKYGLLENSSCIVVLSLFHDFTII